MPSDVWFDAEIQKWLVVFEANGPAERVYVFALSADVPMPVVLSVHRITARGNEWVSESLDS